MTALTSTLPAPAARPPTPTISPTDIVLSRVAPALIDRYGVSPSYRVLASMVRDGQIRAKVVGGRYYLPEDSLPALAVTLGLTPAAVEHAAT